MKVRPVGYQVLIEMEAVEREVKDGALKGFQLQTEHQREREQGGHDIGTIVAFGPIAFLGYANCTGPESYGVKVGDRVEFRRYDGKLVRSDETETLRIINDSDILVVIEDE